MVGCSNRTQSSKKELVNYCWGKFMFDGSIARWFDGWNGGMATLVD